MTKKDRERLRKQQRWERLKSMYSEDPDFVWLLGEMQEFDLIRSEIGPDGWLLACMLSYCEYYRREGFVYDQIKRECLEKAAKSHQESLEIMDRLWLPKREREAAR